jgi:hypothetical protein
MDVVYDRGLNAFVVTFNHVPQRVAALDKKNYHFTFAAKPCRISHIAMAEKDDKQVHVFIENADEFSLRESPVMLARKFEASFKNIKDLQGNEVNEIKYKRVNQFRELFLQKLDATLNQRQGPFIAKEAPLQQNPVDSLQLHGFHYWMNTPLRSSADWERVPLH